MQNNRMRVAIIAVAALLGSAASAQQTAKIDFKSVGRAWPLSADVNKLDMVGPTNRRPAPTGANAPTPGQGRAVAAEVPLVGPRRAVFVEVFRGEEIHGQRVDTRRVIAVARRAHEVVVLLRLRSALARRRRVRARRLRPAIRGADHLELVHIGGERPRPAHALEVDLRRLLRGRSRPQQGRYRDDGYPHPIVLHASPGTSARTSHDRPA